MAQQDLVRVLVPNDLTDELRGALQAVAVAEIAAPSCSSSMLASPDWAMSSQRVTTNPSSTTASPRGRTTGRPLSSSH